MVCEAKQNGDALYEAYCQGMSIVKSGSISDFVELQKKDASFPHQITWLNRHWLTHAIDAHALVCIEWMIQQNVAVNYVDDDGYSPLKTAVESAPVNDIRVVHLLLKSGANPNAGTNPYNCAIHWAANLDRSDILALMKSYGANLDLALEDLGSYYTPLDFIRDSSSKSQAYEFLRSRGYQSAYELGLHTHKKT
jgi:hypothetical protein